jgi:hypothetical protein
MDISKWAYVRIELEIMGVVVDTRHVQGKDHERVLEFFKAVGKCQPYEWAVFVKRHIGKKSLYQRELRRRKEREEDRLKRENVNNKISEP